MGNPQTSIVRLRVTTGPPAIIRRVIAIVVDTVQRQAWRASSHIGIERREVVLPPRTDTNTSASIVLIGGVFRVLASTAHETPTVVLRRIGQTMFRWAAFGAQASTRSCVTAPKIHLENDGHSPTGAAAMPASCGDRAVVFQSQDNQSAKALARQIKRLFHMTSITYTGGIA